MKNTLKIDFENSRIVMDRTFAKNVQNTLEKPKVGENHTVEKARMSSQRIKHLGYGSCHMQRER